MAQSNTAIHSEAVAKDTSKVLQAFAAALLGMALFAGVTLSHPNVIHNAAHDSRHGIAVPCH